MSRPVLFLKHFIKATKTYSLWDKGDGWHELTHLDSGGYHSIGEWYNTSVDTIEVDLLSQGYTTKI